MKNRFKLQTLTTVIAIISILNIACSSNTPQVKPDNKSNESVVQLSDETSEELITIETIPTIQITDSLFEMSQQDVRNLNHISMIELACGYYHDAYNYMPSSPVVMVDDFMFIWPGNIFTGQPIKILEHSPNPFNPADLGNIYYNRVNEHEAFIQYLTLDLEASTDDEPVWYLVERKVRSDSAEYLLNMVVDEKSSLGIVGKPIVKSSPMKRKKYGYTVNLRQTISFMLNDALKRKGDLDESLVDSLKEGRYFVSKHGFDVLKKAVYVTDIYFSVGKYEDNTHFFVMCDDPYKDIKPFCKKYILDNEGSGHIVYHAECPDSSRMSTVMFGSKNIDKLDIPENLIITKEDVI